MAIKYSTKIFLLYVALYKISLDFSREKNIQPSSSDQKGEKLEGLLCFSGGL